MSDQPRSSGSQQTSASEDSEWFRVGRAVSARRERGIRLIFQVEKDHPTERELSKSSGPQMRADSTVVDGIMQTVWSMGTPEDKEELYTSLLEAFQTEESHIEFRYGKKDRKPPPSWIKVKKKSKKDISADIESVHYRRRREHYPPPDRVFVLRPVSSEKSKYSDGFDQLYDTIIKEFVDVETERKERELWRAAG